MRVKVIKDKGNKKSDLNPKCHRTKIAASIKLTVKAHS